MGFDDGLHALESRGLCDGGHGEHGGGVVDADVCGIGADCGHDLFRRVDVCGCEAEEMSAVCAVFDGAVEGVWGAEHGGGVIDMSCLNGVADTGGADGGALIFCHRE